MTERNGPCNLAAYEQRIRECLVIDEASPSGLRWNHFAAPKVRGKAAGSSRDDGYWTVRIAAKGGTRLFLAHRIVWFLTNGRWPEECIDHINGNPSDNRLANLREASHGENQYNREINTNNTSSVKGVSFQASRGKWRVNITIDRKQIYLGSFDNISDAENAIRMARDRLHGEFANHGNR